jgi:hypothetical protein
MNINRLFVGSLMVVLGLWLFGCAGLQQPSERLPVKYTDRGTVVWADEFEFKPAPPEWKVIQVESGGEFGFGFLKMDPGPFPSQSMFVYDEEPFGHSTNIEKRQEEFFERYLWASPLSKKMKTVEKDKVQVVGGEGLAVTAEGKDPVSGEKVKSKVVFGKRGNRVVSWYITQWRPIDGTYDPAAFDVFDRFWQSFKYLKKSLYETL